MIKKTHHCDHILVHTELTVIYKMSFKECPCFISENAYILEEVQSACSVWS